jgi:hypothetical protein
MVVETSVSQAEAHRILDIECHVIQRPCHQLLRQSVVAVAVVVLVSAAHDRAPQEQASAL